MQASHAHSSVADSRFTATYEFSRASPGGNKLDIELFESNDESRFFAARAFTTTSRSRPAEPARGFDPFESASARRWKYLTKLRPPSAAARSGGDKFPWNSAILSAHNRAWAARRGTSNDAFIHCARINQTYVKISPAGWRAKLHIGPRDENFS